MQPTASTRIARLTATLTLCACADACPEPHRIDRIEQAITIPEGHEAAFTAQHLPAFRGTRHRTIHPKPSATGGPNHRETWVVPLVDPGASIGSDGVVHAWLKHPRTVDRGTSPNRWLQELEERFDGKPQVLKVVLKAGTRESRKDSFLLAITDAEDRHGLTSHPDAPVFIFP